MTKILPFPKNTACEFQLPLIVYREPTAEETTQIVQCLEQIRLHALTLREQLLRKQAELVATKSDVEQLVSSVDCD